MQKLKAIIIDDEASARENLEMLLQRFCPDVILLGAFSNLEDGVTFLKNNQVDVVFLDVDMPNYAGFEITRFISDIDFDIVFITAYNQYAVKAFELSAVDYLLKPVEIDRLKQAVGRVSESRLTKENLEKYKALENHLNEGVKPHISVIDKGDRIMIPFQSIVVIEANGAYSSIHTDEGKVFTISKNLSQIEEEFKEVKFMFRSHKSWYVNLNKIKSFSNGTYQISFENDLIAKVSRYRIAEFKTLLNQ